MVKQEKKLRKMKGFNSSTFDHILTRLLMKGNTVMSPKEHFISDLLCSATAEKAMQK